MEIGRPAPEVLMLTMSPPSLPCSAERALRRLTPAMARAAASTAEAFFPAHGAAAPDEGFSRPYGHGGNRSGRSGSRSGSETLCCSQLNIGERFEMTCDLATDKEEWASLFPRDVPDQVRSDALMELANCICGSLLSDAGLMDELGCLLPCVPSAFIPRAPGASAVGGALRMSSTLIQYSFSVRACQHG